MRAIRLVQRGRPLEGRDVEIPAVGERDVLVRVRAAGICHSDAHYRSGRCSTKELPVTLGHEAAGVVEAVGPEVEGFASGDRVCLHYLATCGSCSFCIEGQEPFCPTGEMMGKLRDGGHAEHVVMPARSVFRLPAEIPFEHGAVMMCSSSTAFHALEKARVAAGDTVAVFGAGGLGVSAIQLARARGAEAVFAVDVAPDRLALAEKLGAIPVDAAAADPVARIRELTDGRGVAAALELVGLALTSRQAVQSLAVQGRAALAGIPEGPFEVDSFAEVIGKEAEIVGVSDHLASELPALMELARCGDLDLSHAITETVPLEADAVNAVLDRLERFGSGVRAVIVP
jgi:2-desacetyl-2-hydroxyethyl bacteriochlorophyllide A dehydrogenase